ncbi:hypothetical protein VCHA53O466_40208 [Vibrio chagasii]|nr:hypothetical protein VCHA53O466_40208 [Vibrio chagasii]
MSIYIFYHLHKMTMKKQSKWIVCGYDVKGQNWIIIGNLQPMLSPEKFYSSIENYRTQFSHFGIWVVPHDWVMNSLVAPDEYIRSIDEIFLDKMQVKTPSDLLDGMMFHHAETGNVVTVMASRDEFVMIREGGDVPIVVHWRDLIANYTLSDKLLK